ncbi:hypothetical protein [Stenotrophomonas maltophilia]|uniref:hypothetical protein n=1 Tax=Stenotrophomonas maltophilia TaxID=40324 RepID=UPI001E2B81B5|nr:hypothetical protein [Stenotrophomonas maltophilia]
MLLRLSPSLTPALIRVAVMAAEPIRAAVMVAATVVVMAGEGMAVVTVVAAMVAAQTLALQDPLALMASLAQATAAALIPVVAPIPATAVVPAAVVALVLRRLFVAVTKSSAHSFFSSGGLGARLRAWAARSRATRVIAKPRTSAKATRSPALKLMSCGSSCAAPGRGTVTAH